MNDYFLGLKVFAVCDHPGGVNAIVPVLSGLRKSRADCYVITGDFGLRRCAQEGIPAEAVDSNLTYETAKAKLCRYNPDCVLLGTSEPVDPRRARLEALFSVVARDNKIPAIAVLDHWCGYQNRFSSTDELLLDALPDIICVMDERARQDMLTEGFPQGRLVVTGNPHWDTLKIRREEMVGVDRVALRHRFGIKDSNRLLLFISEPLAQDRHDERGYTQMGVFKEINRFLYDNPELLCWIKLHPRENHTVFVDMVDKSIRGRITVLGDEEFMDLRAFSADIIIGMTSMLLFEYFLLGLPAISYQPVFSKRALINFGYGVRVVQRLEELRKICMTSPWELKNQPLPFNATENVINIIQKVINRETVKNNG